MHVLPSGFHRIRHFGLFANHVRANHLQRIRELLNTDKTEETADQSAAIDGTISPTYVCPVCGAPMIIVEIIDRCQPPGGPP